MGIRTPFAGPQRPPHIPGMARERTTNDSGIPVASDEQSLTAGPNGPTPFQDAYLVQKMQ